MRSVTFRKGALLEGIEIERIASNYSAVVLGKPGSQTSSTLLSPENPPEVKGSKIYSTALQGIAGVEGRYMISRPINGGPHKRRNNKTLVRIDGFYCFYTDGEADHIYGEWSTAKGNPLILAESNNERDGIVWTDSLIVMSPGDIVSVSYHRPGMKSFFLVYERTHRGSRLVSHDSIYYLKGLNEKHPKDEEGRRLARQDKRIRRLQSTAYHQSTE